MYHNGPIHQNIFYIGVEASDEKLVILNAIIDKYTGEIPHNISPDNRTILILDTSIPYDLIKNIKNISSNVGEIKILDHHSTTSENYGKLNKLNKFTIKTNGQLITNYLYLDEKLSGTTLTYKALFDGRVPYLLKMIEKNDTGKWDIFSSLYAFYEMQFKCNTFLRRLNFMDSIQGNLNIYDNSPEKLLELFTPELIINFLINGIYIKHIVLRASRLIELNFLHNDDTYLYDRGEGDKYDKKKLFIINSPYLYGPVANTCNSTYNNNTNGGILTLVWGITVDNKSKVSIRGKCNEKIFNPSTVIASFGKDNKYIERFKEPGGGHVNACSFVLANYLSSYIADLPAINNNNKMPNIAGDLKKEFSRIFDALYGTNINNENSSNKIKKYLNEQLKPFKNRNNKDFVPFIQVWLSEKIKEYIDLIKKYIPINNLRKLFTKEFTTDQGRSIYFIPFSTNKNNRTLNISSFNIVETFLDDNLFDEWCRTDLDDNYIVLWYFNAKENKFIFKIMKRDLNNNSSNSKSSMRINHTVDNSTEIRNWDNIKRIIIGLLF